jgi:hypothetical protein
MFSMTCFDSAPISPGTGVNVPGRTPICPDTYNVVPTFTASENGSGVPLAETIGKNFGPDCVALDLASAKVAPAGSNRTARIDLIIAELS